MEFGVLGPVTAWHGGREVVVTSGRQRCVLALLSLEAGRVVSVERLVDSLWGDDVPRTARNVVQQCVADLRKLMAIDPGIRLIHKAPGYVLEVDRQRVDVHRFRSLVAAARARDGVGSRVEGLRRALELWRGEPLAGADAPGLAPIRRALVEERLAVLEECLAAQVESGRPAEAVPELTALAAEHPLRERPAGLLMLALYRSGRQADALEHYQRTRQRLAEELGTDPGPALQELHQRILAADPTLTTPAVTPAADTPRPAVVPRQLPAPPAAFVGRRDELDRLDTALTTSVFSTSGRATTVVISALGGAGGIGKTWLALHWAHHHTDRFPDGQLFVDLRGFSPDSHPLNPAVAVRGFLDALGVDPGRIPTDLDAQAALYRSLVADKRMLIVLDNAATTEQVAPLLPGTPTCAVLVTGRRKLASLIDRHGARHLQLDVLSQAEARALLAERLGEQRVTAEPEATDQLIELCGRYPLALSITARHASLRPQVPLSEFTAELRDLGLDMLDDDDPAASLPAVLSWSLRGLTPELRQVFALLGIAPGPDIDLPAAASLTGLPEARTRKVLRALENHSLLDRRPHGRYRMHDLVRAYATTVAHNMSEQVWRAALDRVVDFYLHTAHTADHVLYPHRQPIRLDPPADGVHPHPLHDIPTALAWLDTHHPHLLAAQRASVSHGRHQTVWHLAWTLTTFHWRRGHRHDDLAVWQAAADAADHLPDPTTRVLAHRRLGRAHTELGRHEQAIEYLHRALALAQQHHNLDQQAHTRQTLAWAWARRGDHRQALEHARRALDLYRTLDQPAWKADALNEVGWHAAQLGDYDTARDHCRAALALHRHHNNSDGEATTLDSLGYIDHQTGDHHQAIHHYHQALALRRALGDTTAAADTLDKLGHPNATLGHDAQARAVWREALELYRQQGRQADAERVQRQLDDLDRDHAATTADTPPPRNRL